MPYISIINTTMIEIGVHPMKTENRQFRLIKEKEKLQQVTHWDMDYLPRDEILELYQRRTGYRQQTDKTARAIDESHQTLPWLLIAAGVLLLAGTLCVAWLT
jgi:hypothetical protein